MKHLKGTSCHGYQLAEQIVKIDVGTTWQSEGTRWLTPAKTVYHLGVPLAAGISPCRRPALFLVGGTTQDCPGGLA